MKLSEIIQRIDEFTEQYPDAEYGPAHIVLSDYNLTDDAIDFCLNLLDPANIEEALSDISYSPEEKELEETRAFLRWLRSIPDSSITDN